MSEKYDFCVIGAGSAGVRFARMAAGDGYKVAIVEAFRAGGTCVIRGCVPKKLYAYASRFKGDLALCHHYGWDIETKGFSWERLRDNKETEITRLENIYQSMLNKSGVTFIQDHGSIVNDNIVHLRKQNKDIHADKIIITTGGIPRPLHVGNQKIGLSSDEIFDLPSLPKSIFIYGAGYIALEFSCIFNRLGSDVTIGFRGDKVLRGFDTHLRDHLTDSFIQNDIKLIPNLSIDDIKFKGNYVTTPDFEKEFDVVLNATGRIANVAGLGCDHVDVKQDKSGAIIVDEYSQTSSPNIYALGDVTNRVCLTPVAIEEAMCLYKTLCHNAPTKIDYNYISTAVFTTPEMGTIGITEDEAKKSNIACDIYESHFTPMKYSLNRSAACDKSYMKLIVEKKSQKVIGIHLLGSDSGEMIQCLGIAIKAGLTKDDFDNTMAVHPTAAEELVTMRRKIREI